MTDFKYTARCKNHRTIQAAAQSDAALQDVEGLRGVMGATRETSAAQDLKGLRDVMGNSPKP
jgi:hypothetical protein